MSGLAVSNTNPTCERCDKEASYVEIVYDSKNNSHQLCWNCYHTFLDFRDKAIRNFTDDYIDKKV